MYFFIATILIAELIIAVTLICQINKLDKKVCELSEKVTEAQPKVEATLTQMKEGVAKLVDGVYKLCEFAKAKKQEYTISIIKNILIYLLLFLLKGKSKKYASAIQLVSALRDCWACNS